MRETETQQRNEADSQGPKSPISKRLILAASSFLGLFLLLEIVSRVAFPTPAPVRYRDGVYINVLPLVNGISMDTAEFPRERRPLLEEKAPDEVRVFVFGESSAVGGPWGYAASSATILHDLLASAYPERNFTVVNMGRSGSYTMDAYYYLVASLRYRPDVIIFYNGNNDRYDADLEMCMPGEHPKLYSIWRSLVSHAHLLWTVRVLGPAYLGGSRSLGAPSAPSPPLCAPEIGFRGWADTLVETAAGMGASVIVTLPVASLVAEVDVWEMNGPVGAAPNRWSMKDKSPEYRQLLARRLTPGLAFTPVLRAYLDKKKQEHFTTFQQNTLNQRIAVWKGAASRFGGTCIDLDAALKAATPGGVAGPPLIFDEVHLSPKGYWILATKWVQALEERFGRPKGGLSRPSDLPSSPAYAAFTRSIRTIHEARLVFEGLRYLDSGHALMATTMLERAVEDYDNENARVAIGWLRLQLDLPAGLPPELEAKAARFDTRAAQQELGPPEHGQARPPRGQR